MVRKNFMMYSSQEKYNELLKYSNPIKVFKKAKEYNINPNDIYMSWLKRKKYVLITPDNEVVHFGFMGMEDYTHHNNETRRDSFKKRNAQWKDYPKYSAGWLSYYLTW
jgi:hypothetical protein